MAGTGSSTPSATPSPWLARPEAGVARHERNLAAYHVGKQFYPSAKARRNYEAHVDALAHLKALSLLSASWADSNLSLVRFEGSHDRQRLARAPLGRPWSGSDEDTIEICARCGKQIEWWNDGAEPEPHDAWVSYGTASPECSDGGPHTTQETTTND
jgi:hypothetical protein